MSSTGSNSFNPELQPIGAVYAKSVLAAAKSNNELENIVQELDELGLEVLPKQPKLVEFLSASHIRYDVKAKLVDSVFGGRASSTLVNFLKVVCQHDRFDCIFAIIGEARRIFNEEMGVVDVTVTTASPIDDALNDRIVKSLEGRLGKKVNVESEVDPSMLGGLRIRVGDTVFDGGMDSQLERARREAFESASEKIRSAFDKFAISG